MNSSNYLARAIKIIMHTNYIHTRNHPHRTHQPLQLDLDPLQVGDAPFDLEEGTGMTVADFAVGDQVEVWHVRTWWHGKVIYKSVRGTLNVRLKGAGESMNGLLPTQIKHKQ
jgi:hypothetical protein